jgi:CheY-like chemotaxis protein
MSLDLPENNRLLIVEDHPIIAMDVEFILLQHGAVTIDTAATVAEAMNFIAAARPDAAVLDLNLGASTSLPIAEELHAQAIPFVFTTGYGESAMIPSAIAHVPVVGKPYDTSGLVNALAHAIAASKSAHTD